MDKTRSANSSTDERASEIALERKPSRRDLLKTGASIAAAASAIPLVASDAAAQARMPMLARLIACSERSATGDAASC